MSITRDTGKSKWIPVLILGVIQVFGADAMYGQVFRNGYIDALIRLRDVGPHHLPGSMTPILKRYVGIRQLDDLLVLASVLFANVRDGSRPELSLYAFQFAGQLVPIFAIVFVEGLRVGSGRNALY
jgi:hypothetical protein